MPRKRATRVNKRAKPKKPEGDVGSDLDPQARKEKLQVFLNDFETEVKERLYAIEKEKIRIQSLIEKALNLQLNTLPVEIRNMNIMDFVAAGGTVEAALLKLQQETVDEAESDHESPLMTKKKERGGRKGKLPADKTHMPPPSTALATGARQRSRFRTPSTRQLPAVWDTPAVTPKFNINLPFTPGIARAPRQNERLMSIAGSPVDVSTMQKSSKQLKRTQIPEEEDMDSVLSRVAASVPHIAKRDIHTILSSFTAAKDS